MPALAELVQAVVKCVGREQFIRSQFTILEQWASHSEYIMDYDEKKKVFEFNHVSLTEN